MMSAQCRKRGFWIWASSLIGIAFGLLTIKEGGGVLFGDGVARAAAGNYVPFVVWFNFLAGFAYVIAGAGLWALQRWAVWLSILIAGATAVTFLAFAVLVFSGSAHELRTVLAMTLRTLVWAAIGWVAYRALWRSP